MVKRLKKVCPEKYGCVAASLDRVKQPVSPTLHTHEFVTACVYRSMPADALTVLIATSKQAYSSSYVPNPGILMILRVLFRASSCVFVPVTA